MAMVELLRTNDPVRLSWVMALLSDAAIESVVFDTHASIAVKAGVPIGVVSERLGHSDPGFTLARYSHIMPGMQREAADKIARAVHLDDITAD